MSALSVTPAAARLPGMQPNEPRYYLEHEGRTRGPFDPSGLRELVASGDLTRATKMLREGTTEWSDAGTLAPELFVAPRPRASGRTKLLLGLGLGLALGGVALVVAYAVTRASGGPPDLADEVLLAALPSDVDAVKLGAIAPEPLVLRASAFNGIFGGYDLAGALLDPDDTIVDALARPDLRADLQRMLGVAAALDGLGTVEHGEQTLFLFHGSAPDGGAPLTLRESREHSFSGLEGRCTPSEGGDGGVCSDGPALVRRAPWTLFARRPVAEAVARDWVRTNRPETTNMEVARALLRRLEGHPEAHLDIKPESLRPTLIQPCVAVLGLAGVLRCLPSGLDATFSRLSGLTRGVAREGHPPLHPDPERYVVRFDLLARDARDAESIAAELDAFRRDWRAHFDNQGMDLVAQLRGSERADADFVESRYRTFERALAESTIETEDAHVVWTLATDLTDAEQSDVARHVATRAERVGQVERVLTAVLEGTAPPRPDLVALVGEERADAMLVPRATAEDCEAIRAHVAELVAAGVPTAQFGLRFQQETRFAEGRCAGTPLTPEARACLVGAADFAAMAACELPSLTPKANR